MPTAFTHDPSMAVPSTTTDTGIAKWSGTTGGTLLNSGVLIDSSNNVTIPGYLYLSGDEKELRFYEGSHYVAIKTNASLNENYTLTLPLNDGAANEFLQTNGSGVLTWAAVGASAVTRAGGVTTEATTTSTGKVELLSATSMSIAGSSPIHYVYSYRKTTGAAAQIIQSLELNNIEIFNASSGSVAYSDGNNEVESGFVNTFIGPKVTNYVHGNVTGTWATYAGVTRRNDGTVPDGAMYNACPTATITTLTAVSKLSSASITGAFDELHVYNMAIS